MAKVQSSSVGGMLTSMGQRIRPWTTDFGVCSSLCVPLFLVRAVLSFRQALADEAFVLHPAIVPRCLSLRLALPTTHSWHGFSIADCIAPPLCIRCNTQRPYHNSQSRATTGRNGCRSMQLTTRATTGDHVPSCFAPYASLCMYDMAARRLCHRIIIVPRLLWTRAEV